MKAKWFTQSNGLHNNREHSYHPCSIENGILVPADFALSQIALAKQIDFSVSQILLAAFLSIMPHVFYQEIAWFTGCFWNILSHLVFVLSDILDENLF